MNIPSFFAHLAGATAIVALATCTIPSAQAQTQTLADVDLGPLLLEAHVHVEAFRAVEICSERNKIESFDYTHCVYLALVNIIADVAGEIDGLVAHTNRRGK